MRNISTGLTLSQALESLKDAIIRQVETHRDNRDFDNLLTALISDLNDLSRTRLATDFPPILQRMFERLNTRDDGSPLEQPFDTRWSAPEYQVMSPIAISITEIAQLVELLREQVYVYTATGPHLEALGRDYDFPRFQATHALRIGYTENRAGQRDDFPLGSLLVGIDTGRRLEFEIYQTGAPEIGDVIFRCTEPGTIGNLYEGDLLPGQPINNIGRAAITGTSWPGQDRETIEQYRRRFLRFLRHRASGGNVPQYVDEVQSINGVGDVMVFPVWRGEATSKLVIVDGQNQPVTPEFVSLVQQLIDPQEQPGAGFNHTLVRRDGNTLLSRTVHRRPTDRLESEFWMGIAPIGHRVTVDTPVWHDIDIFIRFVLVHNIQLGQVEAMFNDILEAYFIGLRQSVVDEWERSYFNNDGISNAWADLQSTITENRAVIETFRSFVENWSGISDVNRQILHSFADSQYNFTTAAKQWFPALAAKQTHTWYTLVHPQTLGVELLNTGLVSAVDFENLLINGERTFAGYSIEQTQEAVHMPRIGNITLEVADYIATPPPVPPQGDIKRTWFFGGFDNPVSKLKEVISNEQ